MVKHVADWVVPFPRGQRSRLPPLKFFHNHSLLPLPSTLRVLVLGAISINQIYKSKIVN